jgi:hypothetical protein
MAFGDWLTVLFVVLGTLVLARVVLSFTQRRLAGFPPDLSPLLLLLVYVVWPQVDLLWALIIFSGAVALIAARYLLPRARRFDAAIGLLVLALYLITLGDHVGRPTRLISGRRAAWGIAHPTGYPLFVGLGKLFRCCLRIDGVAVNHPRRLRRLRCG